MKLNSDILVFITFSCESQLIGVQNEKEKRNGNVAKCTAANEIVTPSTPHFREREREREGVYKKNAKWSRRNGE